jgi:hypothetical protein
VLTAVQCAPISNKKKKKKHKDYTPIKKKTIKDHSALMIHHSTTYSNAAPIQSHSQTKEKKKT